MIGAVRLGGRRPIRVIVEIAEVVLLSDLVVAGPAEEAFKIVDAPIAAVGKDESSIETMLETAQ